MFVSVDTIFMIELRQEMIGMKRVLLLLLCGRKKERERSEDDTGTRLARRRT